MAMLLVGCAAGAPSGTGSSAERLTTPWVSPFARPPQRGPRLPFTPSWRRDFKAPSGHRPEWLPTLPENLPRIPVPDDGFRDNLAMRTAAGTCQSTAKPA
jgi:hypothetical protein